MERQQLEQALASAMAMREQYPPGSPEYQACLATEHDLRRRLATPPPPERTDGGGDTGPQAIGPRGMQPVLGGYFDDRDNPDRGGQAYQDQTDEVDPRYLGTADQVPDGYRRHTNVGPAGGAPPPPPAPPANGTVHRLPNERQASPQSTYSGRASAPAAPTAPPRRGLGRIPLPRFSSVPEAVGWGATLVALGWAGWKAYAERNR